MKEKTYLLLTGILLSFSVTFDTLNSLDLSESNRILVGAISPLLSLVISGIKENFNPINKNTRNMQILLFVVYLIGGLMESIDAIPLSEDGKSALRLVLTFLNSLMPIIIKFVNFDKK